MRRVVQIFTIIAVLLSLAIWQRPAIRRWIDDAQERVATRITGPGASEAAALLPEARRSIAYLLGEGYWTRFSLSGTAGDAVRIITNANLPAAYVRYEEDAAWAYAVAYEVLDEDDALLRRGTYHHLAEMTPYLLDEGRGLRAWNVARLDTRAAAPALNLNNLPPDAEIVHAARYLDPTLAPLDGRVIMLDLAAFERPAYLRLRIKERAPGIEDVVARVYGRQKISGHQVGYWWNRLRPDQRERLVRGNVYPPDLVSEQEKSNLLWKLWEPVGPVGVEGRDYFRRNIYVLTEPEMREAQRVNLPPEGVLITNTLYGVAPLPPEGGRIRLRFLEAGLENGTPPQFINLHWFGKGIRQRASYETPWVGHEMEWEADFRGGLLEMSVDCPETQDGQDGDMPGCAAVARVFRLEPGGAEQEITPPPMQLRTYATQEGFAVEYPIRHSGDAPTPLRVDLRQLFLEQSPAAAVVAPPETTGAARPDTQDGEAAFTVTYAFLDADGVPVREGALVVNQPPTLYDRLPPTYAIGAGLSEPGKFYFVAPPRAAALRLASEAPVATAAYNRPPGLVREMRVPEDYYAFEYDDENRQAAWFPLRPNNWEDLLLSNRSPLLTLQFRTPEDDPDMIAGRYQWEDLLPEEDWAARQLFVKREDSPDELERVLREEALAVAYVPLPRGETRTLRFQPLPGMPAPQPSLVYLRDTNQPVHVRVWVDGALHYDKALSGARGEAQLDAVSTGVHQLRLEADSGRWFINHAVPGGPQHLKRWAVRFRGESLTFNYTKRVPGEQVVMVEYYPPFTAREPYTLHVDVAGPGRAQMTPLRGWTFTNRRFIVQPPQNPAAVPVLGTRDETMQNAEHIFLPLAEDQPPGEYRIRLTREAGPEGYVVLSTSVAGRYEDRRFRLDNAAHAGAGAAS